MVEHSLGVGAIKHQDQGDDVGSTPAMPSTNLVKESKPADNRRLAKRP